MKEPVKSYSSLASTNTSPVSTLTGSSDVDMCRVLQDSGIYTTGSNSIGSIMSMSEKSTSSLSPVVRRHSLTGNVIITISNGITATNRDPSNLCPSFPNPQPVKIARILRPLKIAWCRIEGQPAQQSQPGHRLIVNTYDHLHSGHNSTLSHSSSRCPHKNRSLNSVADSGFCGTSRIH